jgi:hypothetical protein
VVSIYIVSMASGKYKLRKVEKLGDSMRIARTAA